VFAASLTFLTPLGALLGLVGIVPLAALAWSVFRTERVASELGLERSARRRLWLPALLTGGIFIVLGLAAAQPALQTTRRQTVRTQSEVFFVVDVSRSMAAAPRLTARTRLGRARTAVARLRGSVPDVPSGLAGLTDRVLPYLFPTVNTPAFDDTLRRSVAIESPPPQQVSTNATSFASLASLASGGFFDRSAHARTCVLVTDGESRSYSPESVVQALAGPRGCRLLVVRVGDSSDRVFGSDGSPEAGYAPDPAAGAKAEQLAEAAGGRAFDEHSLGAAGAALRTAAAVGPTRLESARATTKALAPAAAAVALVLALALVAARAREPHLRKPRF
jgi:hypothetical protein